jgi:UDP-glucose 4-epimerase
MSEHVLITGVAGFIGSNLLDYLIDETDWEIDGLDNLSTGHLNNINTHLGNDRFNFINKSCSDITSLLKYSKVFHLAALPRIQPSFELITEHIKANLLETCSLIELMINEKHFPKLVYSGSSSIYGTPLNYPTGEEERIDCLSPYAFQKYEVEKYLQLIATRYPLNYVTLRYFNPFGPRSFNPENKFNAYSSVVGIFLNQYKKGNALTITGDGSQRRDFIHVKDVASANYLASIAPDYINDFFNIGFGKTISILDMAKLISDKITFIEKREGESEITWANISKAKNKLGWTPSVSLENYILEEINVL